MSISRDHTLHREEPRISANDLARYMVAGETGKIGIIRRTRDSKSAPRMRYRDARSALKTALCDATGEKRIISAARSLLVQRADDNAASAFVQDDALKSIDALDAYGDMRNQLAGFDYQAAPKRQSTLMLAGVEVSVYADLLIHRTRKDKDEIGGLLFRLTAPDEDETANAAAKRREMGLYVATLVHMHVTENLAGNRAVHNEICWSVNVQHKEVYSAPKNYLTRAKALTDACRFISAMWDTA